MSLYYRAKRIGKLALVCGVTYLLARGCANVVFGQEVPKEQYQEIPSVERYERSEQRQGETDTIATQGGSIDDLIRERHTVRTLDSTAL